MKYKRVLTEKPRQIAARILLRRSSAREYVEDILDRELAACHLSPPDRGLLQELVAGVVRWQGTLDWLIDQRTQGRKQKETVLIVLRLTLYQMFWLQRIPDHAAVNEAVSLAKDLGCEPQSGFVNALLRGCAREREKVKSSLEELKRTQPALGYSHPDWLIARWRARWGEEPTRQLLDWNNTPPKSWARVNTLRTQLEALRELWAEERVEVRFHSLDWVGEVMLYEMVAHPPFTTLGSFKRGCFYLQDPSTVLAVTELSPQPGESILDYCAAPGGKTTLIAQLLRNTGRVVARDNSLARLSLVKQNCERLGVTCVEPVVEDAPSAAKTPSLFDRVLVDAPCSNTGVMRRRLDLRWLIRAEEIGRLHATQLGLLKEAALRVKPGGVLVYSTCSLEPEENAEVIKAFLETHPRFRLQRERSLLPFEQKVDGAYVARLQLSS